MTDVTIGMPLYNNAVTLPAALDSLLSQTMGNFGIILSNDCSRDETDAICREYCRRDSRIEYVRQEKNLGYANFRFVLNSATSPYFMWAAGDDRWAPTFIQRNLDALKADASLVASVSRVQFESGGQPVRLSNGTYPLLGTVAENLTRYLNAPGDNSRMYGVFRTDVLQRSFPERSFHAYDWALSAATLLEGRHNEISDVLMYRDWTPPARYSALVRKDHASLSLRLLPVLAMTWWLVTKAKMPLTRRTIGALVALNIDKHFEYAKAFHPKYFERSTPVERAWRERVRWRLRLPEE